MSDEIHMQAAWRHADLTALQPWRAVAPDEALMAAEEALAAEDELPRRAWLHEALMAFLFADGDPERWENVALRALVLLRDCLPFVLVGREMREVEGLKKRARMRGDFLLGELVELCADEEWRRSLEGIMGYLFPARRKWLFKGTQRAYLVARAYQPHLVTIQKLDGGRKVRAMELGYEDMARIFEGDALTTEAARNRARSRWSARAQALIRKPIEAAGGTVHLQFGKSTGARAAMANSAAGNKNRKGTLKSHAPSNVQENPTT